MERLFCNTSFTSDSYSNKDVLSAFNKTADRTLDIIHQGMSEKEISEVVSEKIISVVKKQFEATKKQFETKEKK